MPEQEDYRQESRRDMLRTIIRKIHQLWNAQRDFEDEMGFDTETEDFVDYAASCDSEDDLDDKTVDEIIDNIRAKGETDLGRINTLRAINRSLKK